MSCVQIESIQFLNNPAKFTDPINLDISFNVSIPLKDLEFKIVYVGSAEDTTKDQILDSILISCPIPGSYQFQFVAEPPNPTKIPEADLLGYTALLFSGYYKEQEFVRVGYYLNNVYIPPGQSEPPAEQQPAVQQPTEQQPTVQQLTEQPPTEQPPIEKPIPLDRVQRKILNEPRVTHWLIKWGDTENPELVQPEQTEAEIAGTDIVVLDASDGEPDDEENGTEKEVQSDSIGEDQAVV